MNVGNMLATFGFELDKQSFNAVESEIKRLERLAISALGAVGITNSVKALNQMAEAYEEINQKVASFAKGIMAEGVAQKKVLELSEKTRRSYQETTNYVAKAMESDAFSTMEEALTYVELVSKHLQSLGKTDTEISTITSQLNQALSMGKMELAQFNTLLKQSPSTVELLEKSLGKSEDELKAMAKAGTITADVLKKAFSDSSSTIESDFESVRYKISDAIVAIKDEFGLFVNDIWRGNELGKSLGETIYKLGHSIVDVLDKSKSTISRWISEITRRAVTAGDRISSWISKSQSKLSTAIDKVGNLFLKAESFVKDIVSRLGGVENVLDKAGKLLDAFIQIAMAKEFLNILEKVMGALSLSNLKMLLLFAIIQDIVYFLLGYDSLLENILIGQGKTPEEIQEIKDNFSNMLSELKDSFIPAMMTLLELATKFIVYLAEHEEDIIKGADKVGGVAKGWLDNLAEHPFWTLLKTLFAVAGIKTAFAVGWKAISGGFAGLLGGGAVGAGTAGAVEAGTAGAVGTATLSAFGSTRFAGGLFTVAALLSMYPLFKMKAERERKANGETDEEAVKNTYFNTGKTTLFGETIDSMLGIDDDIENASEKLNNAVEKGFNAISDAWGTFKKGWELTRQSDFGDMKFTGSIPSIPNIKASAGDEVSNITNETNTTKNISVNINQTYNVKSEEAQRAYTAGNISLDRVQALIGAN